MAGLLDLPLPLLSSIVGQVHSIADTVSVRCSCRALRVASQEAPLSLRVDPGESGDLVANEARMQKTLNSVVRTLNNVVALDLRGCPVTDVDVCLLHRLRDLRWLNLANCQKLTLATVHALTWGQCGTHLEFLNLQRCFRLTDSVAGNKLPLLELLIGSGSTRHLACLLLSHIPSFESLEPVLFSEDTGQEGSTVLATPSRGYQHSAGLVAMPGQRVPDGVQPGARGLTVLALHNCGMVQFKHLVALAAACSGLETLCLGGSRVVCHESDNVAEVFAGMQRLRLLELTFWDGQGACTSGQASHFISSPHSIGASMRDSLSAGRQGAPVRVWDLCNSWDVEAAYLWFSSHQASAHQKSALSAAANCSDLRRCTPLHVAASRGDVTSVVYLLAIGAAAGGEGSVPGDGPKDVGGATALFLAAENGHADCVEALARGGANVLASNRGNESPLYIAALKGHLDVVTVLLRHCRQRGLKWQEAASYGDGWTPLMAAAVANRQHVATLLLETACTECASDMPDLLPPGLSSRFISSTVLIRESRQHTRGPAQSPLAKPIDTDIDLSNRSRVPPTGSVPLLDAQNRYGSTALHISAMKSLSWFVLNLLKAGADWRIEDSYGKTARQVAAEAGHRDIEQMLQRWTKEATGIVEGRQKGQHRSRKARRSCGDSQQNLGGRLVQGGAIAS